MTPMTPRMQAHTRDIQRACALFLIFSIAFISVTFSVEALSLTGPTWTPSSAFKNNTINCSWSNSSDTLAQNITLFKNGVQQSSSYENASSVMLSSSTLVLPASLTKNDIWVCRIALVNETDLVQQETSITILNSPPVLRGLPAGVFNASGEDIGDVMQILEDAILLLDANATDSDSDSLTYLSGEEFCTRTSSSAGTYTCSPSQSDIINNLPTLVNISFSVTDGRDGTIRTITFNITPENDLPVLVLENQTTPVNSTLNYTFVASDPELNYPLTYILTAPAEISGKLSLISLNSQGTSVRINYDATVVDYNDIGLWQIQINVTDNYTTQSGVSANASALYNFTLNITPVGRTPYFNQTQSNITPINGMYWLQQGESVRINVTANDLDVNTTLLFFDNTPKFAIATIKGDNNASDAIGQLNFTATNADVGLFNVTITVLDPEGLSNTTLLQFNVSDVNDPPIVNQMSYSSSNTQGNQDASGLQAYANTPFIYDVNGTDPDSIHGDTLVFSDNTSLFAIDASTGRISFTPQSSDVGGPYHINVSVVDGSGLRANRTIILSINSNTPPYFTEVLPRLDCTTKALCGYNVSNVSADDDPGDSVNAFSMVFVGSNLSNFTYNISTGIISFIVPKTAIGNYTLNITITDTFGASNSTLMNISVTNTPEAPILTSYDFSGQTIVETHLFVYQLQATDEDFRVMGENVTFTTNMSMAHVITPLPNQSTTARAYLSFTPSLGDAGFYSVQINATDSFGLKDTKIVNFQVYSKVDAPNITNITPWGTSPLYTIQTTFTNATDPPFTGRNTIVVVDEGTTVLFNLTALSVRPLSYAWSVNGTPVASTQEYSHLFDYFSVGHYSVMVNVTDDRLENSVWNWTVRVTNVNRAPVLISGLDSPLEVNGTTKFSSYFTTAGGQRFLDPDDDRNSNNAIDGSETNSLVFSTTSLCVPASLTIAGGNLTVGGVSVGSCLVVFNATDTGGLSVSSGIITINITDIPEGAAPVVTIVSSGGGGSSRSTFIPITKKKETPKAFNLITPKLVTVYSNKSIDIPITINNTWNGALKGLMLSAETNETRVETHFDINYFEEIPMNQSRQVVLTVSNYRFGDNYEVRVLGNVSDPKYEDSALILLNSIEQSSDGDDVKVKVTFANDLVNEHPECQELNEVLSEAKQRIEEGNLEEGERLVDTVINGCKYLVSTQQRVEERPMKINPIINLDELSVKTMMWGLLAFVVIISLAFLSYYHYSHKPEDDI